MTTAFEQLTSKQMTLCRKCGGSPIMDALKSYDAMAHKYYINGYQVFCMDCENNSERATTEDAAEANWEKENAEGALLP